MSQLRKIFSQSKVSTVPALVENIWHTKNTDTVFESLHTSVDGLSKEEVNARLIKYGPNRLADTKSRGPLLRFLYQFHNVLIYVLIVAAVITAILQHWIDAGVIFGVVFINAIIGFVQEGKAENALQLVGAEHIANRPIAELSGGELQRVCIARSIVKNPKLIILDEPAAGIDAVGESDLYNLMEEYQHKSDATILMITHDWHIANHHSDFVLVLNKKQISFAPPSQSLLEENLRRAFGHIGHDHTIKIGHQNNV